MRQMTTTVTQRGQVTIPAQIRRRLGIKTMDKVTFTINDNNEVRLAPAAFTLESAFGSIKPSRRPEDWEQLIQEAKEERAEKILREMRRSR